MDIEKMLAEIMEASIEPEIFISKAAEILDMHTQTLRKYDRVGIVSPSKNISSTRRYSNRDIVMLKEAKRLSKLGINKEGIKYILQLQKDIIDLKAENNSLKLKINDVKHIFESDEKGYTEPVQDKKKQNTITIQRIEWIE
jgi:DNA-binding transcriptional MerR regulator